MQPKDAAEISELFFAAGAPERAQILHNLNDTPLKASARIPEPRARRALHILEMAAFASDAENFALELGEALILPTRIAGQVTNDAGGEPLACAMKALDTPSAIFQRVLLFLNPEFGTSVQKVYRISRLYDHLTERSALVMIAAWRGSSMATARAKYRPALYDDERQRARSAPGADAPRRAARQRAGGAHGDEQGGTLIAAIAAWPDRGNAALPGPRSRQSTHLDRNGFPWRAVLRPSAPAPAPSTPA